MLRLKTRHCFCQGYWPLVDLIDFNHRITRQSTQKTDLKPQLGTNYDTYNQTSYRMEYLSHKKPTFELQLLSQSHPCFRQTDRIFDNLESLKQVRELESPSQYNKILKDSNDLDDGFPLDSMENYKPKLIVDNLNKQQLVLFNIPLNSTENDIQQFVKRITKQDVAVDIQRCSLNLNSHAILQFQGNALKYKDQLHLQRMNGVLMECKSQEDSEEQTPMNRTLVITNLNRSLNFQNILHKLGQYGRVINAVIPLEIENKDYALLEDVLAQQKEPVKLEILDVETGETQIRFHPTEEEFFEAYKAWDPEYYDPNLAQTLVQFETELDERENQIRLYRILTQKTIKCLKVPEHKKEQYKKVWMPQYNVEKPKASLNSDLYNKTYLNRGYCVCTFSSKAMAQRALLAINKEGSKDLSQLQIPMINNPQFEVVDNSHSKNDKYGGRFRVENLYLPQIRAMKAWEGVELYQVDLMYNLKQLEQIKNKIADVRDEVSEVMDKKLLDKKSEERRDQIRQKVYQDLNMNNQFKEFVQDHSFSKSNNFDTSFKIINNEKVGRDLEYQIQEEEFNQYVEAFKREAQNIKSKQQDFAQQTLDKYQDKGQFQKQLGQIKQDEDDQLMNYFKGRLIEKYKNIEEGNNMMEHIQKELASAHKSANEIERQVNKTKNIYQSLPTEEKKIVEQKILKYKKKQQHQFSTAITNPFYKRKQEQQKHEQFIHELKQLMLGTYKFVGDLKLVAVHPYHQADQLSISKRIATDEQGKAFLDDSVIDYVQQFDIQVGQEAQIRIWEQNRKQLMDSLTSEQITRLKTFSKRSFTDGALEYVKIGIPSETFEITDPNQDPEAMVKELNDLVALANETYEYKEDPSTKKKYIIKLERPYFKNDISILADWKDKDVKNELFNDLIQLGFDAEQCKEFVRRIEEDDDIPEEVLQLIDPDNFDMDAEQIHKEYGITRKEYEVLKNLDFRNNMDQIEDDIQQQLGLRSELLKQKERTEETIIRDDEQTYRVRDKQGRFIVPKFTKY